MIAKVKVWREPTNYWSASVYVRIAHVPNWKADATNFHDADEAMAWGREQVHLAMDLEPASDEDRDA